MSVIIDSAGRLKVPAEEVRDFFRRHWPRPIALADEKFYAWQFVDNPENAGVDDCCVVVKEGKVIGVMGVTERAFSSGGERVKGGELTTWMIAEEERKKGHGPVMMDYLQRNYSVLIGMGISNQAVPLYLWKGFKYTRAIPRYIHVLDWKNIAPHVQAKPLARIYAREQVRTEPYRAFPAEPEEVDRLYASFSKGADSFSRRFDDVRWRYDAHPLFQYEHRVVEAVDGSRCFIAYRIDRGIDGFVVAHGLDLFGDRGAFGAAISFFMEAMREEGVDVIDMYATYAPLAAALRYSGWFSLLDDDFFKFPHLFHPIELREPATTSLMVWSERNLLRLLDAGTLHVTKQDADFDRPILKRAGTP